MKSIIDLLSQTFQSFLKRALSEKPKLSKILEILLKVINHPLMNILIIGLFTFCYFIFFCGIIALLENWYFHDAFWYGFVTFTTIGYGDLYPITIGGKVFYCFSLIGGIAIASLFISNLFDYFLKKSKDELMKNIQKSIKFLESKIGKEEIKITKQDIENAENMTKK